MTVVAAVAVAAVLAAAAAVVVVVVAAAVARPPSFSDSAVNRWTHGVGCTGRSSCSKAPSSAFHTHARGGPASRQFASTSDLRPPCTPAAANCLQLRAKRYVSCQRKSAF